MDGITTRLHWTDRPYEWHTNDGEEVFVVLVGSFDRSTEAIGSLNAAAGRTRRCTSRPMKEDSEWESMGTVTNIRRAKFAVGDLIHHRLFGYRGVIVDVDSTFQLTEEWYETVARSRPPKDRPWYHVLVDHASHATYVAERNLEPDASGEPISHPMIKHFFSRFEGGRYTSETRTN